jgi:hypothetical protein
MNNYLYHSGVKGMKWGIRKDSKRTASLRQQYRSEKDIYKKNLLKARYQDSKIRDRIDQNGLSKRQEKLKNKYIAKGLSKQNAEIAAVKRTDFEKKLLIGAALGASVAAAYAYRNHLRYSTGDVLDKDSVIGRITTYAGKEKIDGFYVYTNKKDSKKYNTLLVGENVLRQKMASPMERILNPNKDKSLYRKTFQATDKIKIASPNEFNKIAYEQYKNDKNFRDNVQDLAYEYGSLKAKIKSVTNKKFSEREVGDIVNRANVLRSHDDDLNKSYNKIYDSLKKKGYSGFIDINDRKYSGYNSKRPTVIIDNKVLKQTGEKIISDSEKKSAYSGYINGSYKASAINFIKTSAVLAIPYAAISGHKQNNDTVNLASEYFRKHKNSTIGLHEAAKNEEESRNKALIEKYSSYSY